MPRHDFSIRHENDPVARTCSISEAARISGWSAGYFKNIFCSRKNIVAIYADGWVIKHRRGTWDEVTPETTCIAKRSRNIKVFSKDVNGIILEHESITACVQALGVGCRMIQSRLNNPIVLPTPEGYTFASTREALETIVVNPMSKNAKRGMIVRTVEDGVERTFSSVRHAAAYHGIIASRIYYLFAAQKSGKIGNIPEISPPKGIEKGRIGIKVVCTFAGESHTFASIMQACRHYGLKYDEVYRELKDSRSNFTRIKGVLINIDN